MWPVWLFYLSLFSRVHAPTSTAKEGEGMEDEEEFNLSLDLWCYKQRKCSHLGKESPSADAESTSGVSLGLSTEKSISYYHRLKDPHIWRKTWLGDTITITFPPSSTLTQVLICRDTLLRRDILNEFLPAFYPQILHSGGYCPTNFFHVTNWRIYIVILHPNHYTLHLIIYIYNIHRTLNREM